MTAHPLPHFASAVEALREIPRVPLITAQVVDVTDAEQFPEMAIARAYARGETPSPELIALADARYEWDHRS